MTTHSSIRPRPGILEIAPYVGGAATIEGANRSIKLSANENPFGPSDKAVEAYRDHADKLAIYPRRMCRCPGRLPRCMGWRRTGSSWATGRTS